MSQASPMYGVRGNRSGRDPAQAPPASSPTAAIAAATVRISKHLRTTCNGRDKTVVCASVRECHPTRFDSRIARAVFGDQGRVQRSDDYEPMRPAQT